MAKQAGDGEPGPPSRIIDASDESSQHLSLLLSLPINI